MFNYLVEMGMSSPIVEKRKVLRIGGASYISIPPEWFKAHNLKPEDLELLLVADKDIRIVNPEHEKEVYDEVSKITRKAKI